MTREEFYSLHTVFYFVIAAIGGLFCYLGKIHPVYDTETGAIIKPYSLPFLIFGVVIICISFIGIAFFCDAENDFLI